jgi:hypothetical protein
MQLPRHGDSITSGITPRRPRRGGPALFPPALARLPFLLFMLRRGALLGNLLQHKGAAGFLDIIYGSHRAAVPVHIGAMGLWCCVSLVWFRALAAVQCSGACGACA